MTYGPTRSVNAELREGMTDGKFKKVITDRGGFPERTLMAERKYLNDTWYGIHESLTKTTPDSYDVITPNAYPTPPAHLD